MSGIVYLSQAEIEQAVKNHVHREFGASYKIAELHLRKTNDNQFSAELRLEHRQRPDHICCEDV